MSIELRLRNSVATILHDKHPAPAFYPALTYSIHLCICPSSLYSPSTLSGPVTILLAFKHTWTRNDKVLNCRLVTKESTDPESRFYLWVWRNVVCDWCAGLVGWLLNMVNCGQLVIHDFIACLPDGWLLPRTIKVPFSEHVLPILQWAHSRSGGCRVPKSTTKGQACCASTFQGSVCNARPSPTSRGEK